MYEVDRFKKRAYKITNTNAGGTNVTVKQLFGRGSETVTQRVSRVVTTAREMARYVDPLLSTQLDPEASQIFEKYFLAPPTDIIITLVKNAMSQLANGICSDHSVKISPKNPSIGQNAPNWITHGYVHNREVTREGMSGTYSHSAEGVIVKVGDIHISPTRLNGDLEKCLHTYLHESSHRFINTKDHDKKGYLDHEYEAYREPGMDPREALVNADSWATFIYVLCRDTRQMHVY